MIINSKQKFHREYAMDINVEGVRVTQRDKGTSLWRMILYIFIIQMILDLIFGYWILAWMK